MSFYEWLPHAKEGVAEAQYNLGLIYSRGKEVPKDDVESAKWYRLAAEQGFPEAQTNLGLMYGKGHGVEQNYAEAIKWYRLAADQNFAAGRRLQTEQQARQGGLSASRLAHQPEHAAALDTEIDAADRGKRRRPRQQTA